MPNVHPLRDQTTRLWTKTKNLDGFTANFYVEWLHDHSKWKTKLEGSYVDPSVIPLSGEKSPNPTPGVRAGEWITTSAVVSGDKAETVWDVTWDRISNHDMEIYAVIRAEYRFIKDNNWTKVVCKKSSPGMDSLFRKEVDGEICYAVCESKCTSCYIEYEKWLSGEESPLYRLGRPKGRSFNEKALSAEGIRQMSDPWFTHVYAQEMRGEPHAAVMKNLNEMYLWRVDKHQPMPLRWLNVYAPKDKFYLLPGVYSVKVAIAGQEKMKADSGDLTVEWSEAIYKPMEFFALDTTTEQSPGIRGQFQKCAASFEELCRKDTPRTAVVAESEARLAELVKSSI